jgi:hypothetical protein
MMRAMPTFWKLVPMYLTVCLAIVVPLLWIPLLILLAVQVRVTAKRRRQRRGASVSVDVSDAQMITHAQRVARLL